MAGLTRFLAMGSEYIDPQYRWRATATWSINGVSLKQVGSVSEVAPENLCRLRQQATLHWGQSGRQDCSHGAGTGLHYGQPTRPSDTIIRGLGFAHYAALIVGAPRVRLDNTFIWNGLQEPA